jgi:deferrochelatase/peroxidase EfeB
MLQQRMYIGDPPGAYDRLLDFLTPHIGTTFFAPTPLRAAGAGSGAVREVWRRRAKIGGLGFSLIHPI